eukprot:365105-Chlamydomonas_euryale.AAC.11
MTTHQTRVGICASLATAGVPCPEGDAQLCVRAMLKTVWPKTGLPKTGWPKTGWPKTGRPKTG